MILGATRPTGLGTEKCTRTKDGKRFTSLSCSLKIQKIHPRWMRWLRIVQPMKEWLRSII